MFRTITKAALVLPAAGIIALATATSGIAATTVPLVSQGVGGAEICVLPGSPEQTCQQVEGAKNIRVEYNHTGSTTTNPVITTPGAAPGCSADVNAVVRVRTASAATGDLSVKVLYDRLDKNANVIGTGVIGPVLITGVTTGPASTIDAAAVCASALS